MKKKILAIDRDDFVKATDDYNSVHFGPEGIAHGCHVLGWAVGQVVEDGDVITGFSDVQFRYPVYLGEEIEVKVIASTLTGRCVRVGVSIGDVQAVVFTMWKRGDKEHAQASSD
jgi:acyl dehydratase